MNLLAARIAAQPFFQGMSLAHIEILSDCAMATRFAKDQLIFREHDLANRFYLLEEGSVILESRSAEGELSLVETIGPGDALGWSWLFPPYRWHFDARATKEGAALFFYGTRLRAICDEDTNFGYDLVRRMAEVTIHRLESTRKRSLEAQAKNQGGATSELG